MAKQLTTRSRGERGVLWVFRGAKGLVGHLGFILVTLGAITLAFSPLSLWWLGVGGALGVAGLVCEIRVRPNYARLADVLVELLADAVTLASGIENIAESMLRSVMSELCPGPVRCQRGWSSSRA